MHIRMGGLLKVYEHMHKIILWIRSYHSTLGPVLVRVAGSASVQRQTNTWSASPGIDSSIELEPSISIQHATSRRPELIA